MGPAIRVDNLSKQYHLGEVTLPAGRDLRETVTDGVRALWRRLGGGARNGAASAAGARNGAFWALKDVSFEVRPGEVVGVIGRNGAGKSTLLKILSRIVEPTAGRAEVRGRMGSLLEVGTGFHPELTGRENIFLNGSVLGMSRREITRKFDEIVAFSEIARFLDTPVKRYSSGMYVRLAFAVAAHLEPEILVIDEVLAVGDAAFQNRCLGKMQEVSSSGRTVLFVSHNMASILGFCSTVFLLESGRLVTEGSASEVIEQYLRGQVKAASIPLEQRTDRRGDGFARVLSLRLSNATDPTMPSLKCGSRLRVELDYEADRELHAAAFMVGIYSRLGQSLYRLDSQVAGALNGTLPRRGTVTCVTDPLNLSPGRYQVDVEIMMRSTLIDHVDQAAFFDIEAEDFYGTGMLPPAEDCEPCLLPQKWSVAQ
jgi:lipopolysaccharide transport system ATP-binding protein